MQPVRTTHVHFSSPLMQYYPTFCLYRPRNTSIAMHTPLHSRCTGVCIYILVHYVKYRMDTCVEVCWALGVIHDSVFVLCLRNIFPVWCTPCSSVHCRGTRPQHTCAFLITAYATLSYCLLLQATKYEHPNAHPVALPLCRRLNVNLCTTPNTIWTHA